MTKKTFTRTCGWCGKLYQTQSDKSRWCCDGCKMKAYRHRRNATVKIVTKEE